MSTGRLDKLIWALIYGGLIFVGLGLAVLGRDATLGGGIAAFGGALTVLGAVLIWVRSRTKER